MKVVVEFTPTEFDQLEASKEEVTEWVVDMLNSSADTWDGGIFLGFGVSDRDVEILIKE